MKLKKARKSLPAATRKTLRLGVSRKAGKIAARGLRGDGGAKAKIKVKATDAAGNSTTRKRTVKLRK